MRPGAHVSTVTTPATSYALVDLTSLKIRLNVTVTTYDPYFNLAIADASAAASAFMNNPIVVETRSDQIWPWRDGPLGALRNSAPSIRLKRWPLVAVESVTETVAGLATALTANVDYLVRPDTGWLVRLDAYGNPRNWNSDPVVVSYQAGFAAIPSDIQDAVSEMVKSRWYAQTRDPAIRERNVEGVMQTAYWFGSGPNGDTDMPPSIQAKLERYRVPVVA